MTIDLPFLDPVAVQDIGYAAVFFVLMLDGANIPFTPVELFLGLTGYLVAIGDLQFLPALLVTVIGNMTGHIISYLLGFTFGKRFLPKYGKYLLITPDRLKQAEGLFDRLGPWSAFIFRFIPGLRTFGSILLGVIRMPFMPFVMLSAAGNRHFSHRSDFSRARLAGRRNCRSDRRKSGRERR